MTASIEILHDPRLARLANGLRMDERHEVLPDGEWIRAVRRHVGMDDLFVYHHRETGAFVLCQWLSHEPRFCQELETMPAPPDRGGWIPMKILELRCKPASYHHDIIRRQILRSRSQRKAARRDSLEQRNEASRWLHRQGKDAAAAMLQQGDFVGEAEGGERLEAMKDMLNASATNRLITY